jgi:FixJ family two-component response regulator
VKSDTLNTYIAVVDDDDSLCRSFRRLLTAAGFQPVTYSSAEAFLADPKHPQFDCLVLDLQLGGMSGLDLFYRILAKKDTTPVIFITAEDAPEAREAAVTAGCAGYFSKNDPGASVIEAIRRITG